MATASAGQHGGSDDGGRDGSDAAQHATDTRAGTLSSIASRAVAAGLAAALAFSQPFAAVGGGAAIAADTAAVGKCLLGNCPKELAACLADPSCVQNLLCLQKCNGLDRDAESKCQIECGDTYENEVVQKFNKCALSVNGCVPKRVDSVMEWPVPPDNALDERFDLNKFQGRWYITAGLNPLFDAFPCQEHYFGVPKEGKLYGRINWRIPKGSNDDFLERTAIQTFDQQENPAVLFNHNNDYLNYTDDWYVLASQPNEYVLIYYKGNNDAWAGYGGATVYSRSPRLPEQYIPEFRAALQKIGRNWDDFIMTDNSCKARMQPKNAADDIARTFEAGVNTPEKAAGEGSLEKGLKNVGSKFSAVEQLVAQSAETVKERNGILPAEVIKGDAQREMDDAEQYLAKVEKQYANKRL
jgi:violaxanthin de-epoxidase